MADNEQQGGGSINDRVQGVIDHIRPLLQADGGDIELVNIDANSGVVITTTTTA